MNKYQNIFTPLTIKNMNIRNRIAMPPMGTNYGGAMGDFTEEHVQYYEKRAKGGTGLIIVENACVDFPMGSNRTTQIRLDHARYMPNLFRLTERLHRQGACVAIQINHSGASAVPGRIEGNTLVSSSNIPSKTGGAIPRPLTVEEIYVIADKYADAARRAQMAGFDAVEVHGAHGYLIGAFASPFSNKRSDEYGGTIRNRARFAMEIIENIKEKCGKDYPVLYRMSAVEYVPGGLEIEESKILARLVEEAGADCIHCSQGVYASTYVIIPPSVVPRAAYVENAAEIKKVVDIPVIAVGRINDVEIAESVLQADKADLVTMARASLIKETN